MDPSPDRFAATPSQREGDRPRIIAVDPRDPDDAAIEEAVAVLLGGGLVAFPTETVYGLGADALDAKAVERVYAAKGRPAVNPLIVHVDTVERAKLLAERWPAAAEALSQAFWPGPLTLVLPKRATIPDIVTAGLGTVGLRLPAHAVAVALIRAVDRPLAAPSANRYTGVSPTRAEHVVRSLGDAVDLVLDAGPTDVGIESTVVRVGNDGVTLLRHGMITRAALESVVGPIRIAAGAVGEDAARASPGQSSRHYSPRAKVVLGPWAEAPRGGRTGVLLFATGDAPDAQFARRMPPEPDTYARELYAAFWDADAEGCDILIVEEPPDDPRWQAVRDRLARAAATSLPA